MAGLRYISKRPSGSTPEALFMQAVYDELLALQPQNSVTTKFKRKPGGYTVESSGGGGEGTSLIQCVVTQLFIDQDFIGVTKYDITNDVLVGAQFFAAKCVAARQPPQEVIDGITVDYSYQDDNTRIATSTAQPAERHVVHRRYIEYSSPLPDGMDIAQCLVYVSRVRGVPDILGDGNNFKYLEISPHREWAYSTDQSGL